MPTRTRRFVTVIAPLSITLSMALTGCMSSVSYEERTPFNATAVINLPAERALRIMTMPLAFRTTDKITEPALRARSSDTAYLTSLMTQLNQELDRHPAAFERVPLPAGPEADDIMRKTIAQETGLISTAEFARIKSFKLPERLVYGTVTLDCLTVPRLKGSPETFYTAEVSLRLVDSQTLTYLSAAGHSQAATPELAISQALRQSVASWIQK